MLIGVLYLGNDCCALYVSYSHFCCLIGDFCFALIINCLFLLVHSQEIADGVSKSAQAVQAAEAGIRQIGALARQQTMCMLKSATLFFFYLKPSPPTPSFASKLSFSILFLLFLSFFLSIFGFVSAGCSLFPYWDHTSSYDTAMIQERASLPIISLQPVVAGAAKKTSHAVGQATKTFMNIISRGEFNSENEEDSGIDRVEI